MRNRLPVLLWLVAAATYAFLYIPLLMVVAYSFNAAKFGAQWTGFSLRWYVELLHDDEMLLAASHSLLIAIIASGASVVLGTLAGLALHRYKLPLLSALIVAPVAIPELLSGVSLLLLFVLLNLTLGLVSIVLSHVAFCISFVAITVRARLAGMDKSLTEAAQDLGASPWQAFRHITLPLIAPGIIAGALLAFTLSIDDFIITFFTAGVDSSTLPLKIYTMIKTSVTPEVNAVSTLLMLSTLVLLLLADRAMPNFLRTRN